MATVDIGNMGMVDTNASAWMTACITNIAKYHHIIDIFFKTILDYFLQEKATNNVDVQKKLFTHNSASVIASIGTLSTHN